MFLRFKHLILEILCKRKYKNLYRSIVKSSKSRNNLQYLLSFHIIAVFSLNRIKNSFSKVNAF